MAGNAMQECTYGRQMTDASTGSDRDKEFTMRVLAIAVLILAVAVTAGAVDRFSMISNPNVYEPSNEPQHGPQNGEGLDIVELRDSSIYYDLASFLDVIQDDYFFDDFSWLGWGTISGELFYQFGPVNGYSYTASATNGLYSIPGAMSTNSAEDPLILTFDGLPVTAVAGDFYATDFDGYPMTTVVTVTLNDGTVVEMTYPTTFVGFTSSVPLVSLTITCEAGSGTWPTYDNFYVGQLVVTPVEEQSWSEIKALFR